LDLILDSWSLCALLAAAFIVGWAAEAGETFMSRALSLSILAWLQTLPEFAVEADLAWNQERDLMIANLTGSLRLLVGLGWPGIFFIHYFCQIKKKSSNEIILGKNDWLSVIFLFLSISYFFIIVIKGSLTIYDSFFLILIYVFYLFFSTKLPAEDIDDKDSMPFVVKKITGFNIKWKIISIILLFSIGGLVLYLSVHPFVLTMQKWSIAIGISTFVFIQWIAPFLSEFPEKLTAFNWARQEKKTPMGIINMVSSNINQWTVLAAMIPIVFNISLGKIEGIYFDKLHMEEIILTIAQSFLGGLLLLDMRFSKLDAIIIFILWLLQFLVISLRVPITIAYIIWSIFQISLYIKNYIENKRLPRAIELAIEFRR